MGTRLRCRNVPARPDTSERTIGQRDFASRNSEDAWNLAERDEWPDRWVERTLERDPTALSAAGWLEGALGARPNGLTPV
jgi:hypothetical protein